MKSNVFEKVLNNLSLDPRIHDGIFKLEEESHMDMLREYLTKRGLDEASAIEYTNKVLEGKYPERQAYNAKGILVTFPTPEYKANAIKKGTHFEQNPAKQAPNVFGGAQQPAAGQPAGPKPAPSEQPPAAQPAAQQPPTTKLSASSASPAGSPPAQSPQPQPVAQPAVQTQDAPKDPSGAEVPDSKEPPPTPPKSPAEKTADKDVIKKMLKGDDYMLEQVITWFVNNAPEYLNEQIETHRKKYER
jgi:hypothetical protein